MSKLKRTHLKDINESTFNLFQQLIRVKEIQYLNEIFRSGGFEIRLAGGAVRDILCDIFPNDIDFASDAKPEEMINLMSNESHVRLITTLSGIKHGTVTARINTSQYEITTLRIDTNTNGRHAEVEFINDWRLDASRRDLTINSMFIDLNGILYDYFNGESDLQNKLIRFVGDPEKRIKEDYLRIFRYFRFHTCFGISGVHEPETIAIIKNNLHGLEAISGERIWLELKRILLHVNCTNSIEMMFNKLQIGKYLGFCCDHTDLTEFYKVQKNLTRLSQEHLSWKPQTLFASLIHDIEELSSIVLRLKLSNFERDSISYIISNRQCEHLNKSTFQKQLALAPKPNQNSLKEFIIQYLMFKGAEVDFIREFQQWEIPKFPFNGKMIIGKVKNNKHFSMILDHLKDVWAQQNFSMTEKQFYDEIDKTLKMIDVK